MRARRNAPATLAVLAVGMMAPHVAAAQSSNQMPPLAFAAAETRPRTYSVCVESSLTSARECALNKCREGNTRDCRITAFCQPAQWAGLLDLRLQGGRTALVMCGVPSRPGLIARLKDVCRSYRPRGLEACELETVWNPFGTPEAVGLRWTRMTFRRGP